jgi:hypothetical protein
VFPCKGVKDIFLFTYATKKLIITWFIARNAHPAVIITNAGVNAVDP